MLKNSLLWEISNGVSKPSYVFGTMHVKDEAAFTHINKAIARIEKCQMFFTEIDLHQANQQIGIESYLLPGGNTLRDYFSNKQLSRMRKILLKAVSLDIMEIEKFKPLIILNKIAESILSVDNARPLDHFLWREAEKLNLELSGLEKISEQVETLELLSIDVQLKMLKDASANISSFRKSVLKLAAYYESEDIRKLYVTTKRSLGKMRRPLLFKRNKIMAERIYQNIDRSSFYAIGAAHLAGDKGILRHLKYHGLSVTAI